MKLVINSCYGGFSLSHKGVMEYAKRAGIKLYAYVDARYLHKNLNKPDIYKSKPKYVPYDKKVKAFCIHYYTAPIRKGNVDDYDFNYFSIRDVLRYDTNLVATVEHLKEEANGECAKLKIVEIPDGIDYEISEYDGIESIEETHRSWG